MLYNLPIVLNGFAYIGIQLDHHPTMQTSFDTERPMQIQNLCSEEQGHPAKLDARRSKSSRWETGICSFYAINCPKMCGVDRCKLFIEVVVIH